MNSLDIMFGIYALTQIYRGFKLGFRKMLYDTVKWVLIFGGAGLGYRFLLPLLLKIEEYTKMAMKVNSSVTGFIQKTFEDNKGNFIADFILNLSQNAKFDRVAVFLILMIMAGFIARGIIVGSFWKSDSGGKILGACFGFVKASIYAIIIMILLSVVMNMVNPEGFYRWQMESRILDLLNLVF
ncbi:CvpA family protein [Proteocatella sphenisci]|uniref:CvpA family protein n=1 Tax=Proteocatella sphenisci TaxID=181070 RepID=UPI00048DA0AD|nr:CvpA family protein [Proteocatella sphenisci]